MAEKLKNNFKMKQKKVFLVLTKQSEEGNS